MKGGLLLHFLRLQLQQLVVPRLQRQLPLYSNLTRIEDRSMKKRLQTAKSAWGMRRWEAVSALSSLIGGSSLPGFVEVHYAPCW